MPKYIGDSLENAPSNWGKWGKDDELGALNDLTEEEVLGGVRAAESGTTFTLGAPLKISAPPARRSTPSRSGEPEQ